MIEIGKEISIVITSSEEKQVESLQEFISFMARELIKTGSLDNDHTRAKGEIHENTYSIFENEEKNE